MRDLFAVGYTVAELVDILNALWASTHQCTSCPGCGRYAFKPEDVRHAPECRFAELLKVRARRAGEPVQLRYAATDSQEVKR